MPLKKSKNEYRMLDATPFLFSVNLMAFQALEQKAKEFVEKGAEVYAKT
jgi:hypothetical protein